MDMIDILIFAGIIFFVSTLISSVVAKMERDFLKDKIDLLKHLDEIIHQVKVEKIGEIEYWFDMHDDQFLAQGKTVDEIVSILKSRFPEHIFLCEGHGGVSAKTEWKFLPMVEFRNAMEKLTRE